MKNINKISGIATFCYLLILYATKYNLFVFIFGTIGMIILIMMGFKTKK